VRKQEAVLVAAAAAPADLFLGEVVGAREQLRGQYVDAQAH
jgi:hypothetical protein